MLTGAKKLSRIICVRVHFKDKVVWIAGNSSGICAEVAKQLAKQGARLVLTARNIELLHSIMPNVFQLDAPLQYLPATS
jgi:NADP-dependent 3-hydroxy acid dehydrogenase YdfG